MSLTIKKMSLEHSTSGEAAGIISISYDDWDDGYSYIVIQQGEQSVAIQVDDWQAFSNYVEDLLA